MGKPRPIIKFYALLNKTNDVFDKTENVDNKKQINIKKNKKRFNNNLI